MLMLARTWLDKQPAKQPKQDVFDLAAEAVRRIASESLQSIKDSTKKIKSSGGVSQVGKLPGRFRASTSGVSFHSSEWSSESDFSSPWTDPKATYRGSHDDTKCGSSASSYEPSPVCTAAKQPPEKPCTENCRTPKQVGVELRSASSRRHDVHSFFCFRDV